MPRQRLHPSPSLPRSSSSGLPPALAAFVDLAAEWQASGLPVRQLLRRRTGRLRSLPSRARRQVENRLYDLARQRGQLENLVERAVRSAPVETPRPDGRQRLLLIWQLLDPDTGALPEGLLDPRLLQALDQVAADGREVPGFPAPVVKELQQRLGDTEASRALAGLESRAPLVLRVRPPATREQVAAELEAAGIAVSPHPLVSSALVVDPPVRLEKHPALRQNRVCVQDAGSQLAVAVLDLEPGQVVFDACAGGGGKAQAICDALGQDGELFLVDQDGRRLRRALERLPARRGLRIEHREQDGRSGPPPELLGRCHRVLVDAPCSGLGTARRHPELKWRYDDEAVRAFSTLQRELALAAVTALRPGGRLLYTTCSLREIENERVAQALAADPRLQPLPIAAVLGDQAEQLGSSDHQLTLWPHLHSTDGFFMALFERVR